ncbi:5-formyltetrahydrofolate cyclo-ligase [Natronomonas salina]|uniref:5-formyltetrahydrofolate cyclo-ligase n=1 Tax=Natronomonas salina TaxID=1710540 RepID=UPI0015B72268|nr:5-formyltetrahydrofolate cyclo-ligase [Natronomonas salina]QLD88401.1 5-formyltetrahydrofolate cyclo-ligase [Natronomonas salina]
MTDKQEIRERVWDHLEAEGYARFPFPPHGRIPNFEDADAAAERAMALPELAEADAVKANPDSPQLPLRRTLLEQGTTVYMAVPRLAEERCFVELDPAEVADIEAAPTVSHMDEYGRQVAPEAVPELDAIVVGSVAVTDDGARIGKGEGYSDLEYAILRELGLVDDETTVVTTVHDSQIVDDEVDVGRHDVPMDVVCTPSRTIRTDAAPEKPAGIFWEDVDDERIEEIPVLDGLRE